MIFVETCRLTFELIKNFRLEYILSYIIYYSQMSFTHVIFILLLTIITTTLPKPFQQDTQSSVNYLRVREATRKHENHLPIQ